jgi:S1-C subfamily serine protease
MTLMLRALFLAALCLVSPCSAAGQPLSVLHVKVVLVDPGRGPTPVPRHALLISDSPPTASPRRIFTALDGTVDVKLRPGTYTVESDRPVAFKGMAYQWTQVIEVVAGRDAVLELTADNAEIEAVAAATTATPASSEHDPSFLLPRWQDSVVTLWTPTSRALGFVVDAKGLVATNQRVIGDATSVEVQLTPAVKVEGRVLAADPVRDVAVLWIDSTVAGSVPPVPLECEQASRSSVVNGQQVFTISAQLRGQKGLTSGTVSRIEPPGSAADLELERRSTGGPVFTADGRVIGITSVVDQEEESRRRESRVVPIEDACQVLGAAEKKMRNAAPPSGTLLPVEPVRPFPLDALEDAAQRRGGVGPYQMSSSDFDIGFITPALAYAAQRRWKQASGGEAGPDARSQDAAQERRRLLTDFGNWSEYVAEVPPVLLVRVTPKLVEGFWAMMARGAARTQGVALPPMKHFKPGFSRMRAFCGTSEVTPIHAFTLEQRVSETDAIREGLYVFDPGAIGPPCGTVKLVLFSEKQPEKGETQVVDPRVLEQLWQDFAPYRAPTP